MLVHWVDFTPFNGYGSLAERIKCRILSYNKRIQVRFGLLIQNFRSVITYEMGFYIATCEGTILIVVSSKDVGMVWHH